MLLLGLSRPDRLEGMGSLPTLELGALPEQRLRELGEQALGPGAPPHVLDRVAERASGNPLFLEESLSMLVESGALVQRAGAWVVADPGLLERVPDGKAAARVDDAGSPAELGPRLGGVELQVVRLVRHLAILRAPGDRLGSTRCRTQS